METVIVLLLLGLLFFFNWSILKVGAEFDDVKEGEENERGRFKRNSKNCKRFNKNN